MPPLLALLLWAVLLILLLRFDPARSSRGSSALWVPVLWLFIIGTRLPSQWLGGETSTTGAGLEEGNALDRSIFLALILLSIAILVSRRFKWGRLFADNLTLVAFLLFGLVSVAWSDFPFVAFKRWFRDLGNYLVVLLVISEADPMESFRVVLRRLCYLLVPLCVVLIKYFPGVGKNYSFWTGAAEYVGAATSKNMLGVICLISGMFFFWDTVTRWFDRRRRVTKRIILVNAAFFAMTVWVLNLSNSATSSICLVLGCLIVITAHAQIFRRRPALLRRLVPVCMGLCVAIALTFNLNTNMATAVGRDPTLTDRTAIWNAVLSMHTNPVVGTGYDSFWLGPRLKQLWQIDTIQGINEAHNGYLEIYLNLGFIGLGLLIAFLIASYRTICAKLRQFPDLACFSLACWTIMLLYNVTEAGFRGGLLWLTFLLGTVAVPRHAIARLRSGAGAGTDVAVPASVSLKNRTFLTP